MYVWTEYLQHRARSRSIDLEVIEHILRFSDERYFDTETRRMVAVGRHGNGLVMVPYQQDNDTVIAITVHATTREQVSLRLRSGRFIP